MNRAVRVWAALTSGERAMVDNAIRGAWGGTGLLQALDADLAEHEALQAVHTAPPFQAFLIPADQAGPRLPAEACDDCGQDVTTGRTALYDYDQRRYLFLGPGCWRDRMLARARGDAVPGDQLQAFPTPQPIRKD